MSRPRDSYRARVIEACKDTPQKLINAEEWRLLKEQATDSAWGEKHLLRYVPMGLYTVCQDAHDPPLHRYTDLGMCHAIAHAMTSEEYALHGPEFCRNLIEATRKWIDPNRSQILRKKLLAHKAKLRSWSPEAKERAKQRYAERSFDGAKEELKSMLAELEAAPFPDLK